MARGDFPSAKQDQYMLRFPDGMRDRLKAIAAENGRSLNAEIIHRLDRTLEQAETEKIKPDNAVENLPLAIKSLKNELTQLAKMLDNNIKIQKSIEEIIQEKYQDLKSEK